MNARSQALAPSELRFAVLAADVVLFTIRDGVLFVRLTAVDRLPHYSNAWAFPGGLIRPHEMAEEAATRLLTERAHIASEKVYLEQLYTFSAPKRDPRGRVVAVAYIGLVPFDTLSEIERDDMASAKWIPFTNVKGLAYDHDEMLQVAVTRLRSRITYTTLISKLMPREFTLTELEKTYACILKTSLDKRNFRKKILKLNILKPLNKKRVAGRSRPAELYRFASSAIKELEVI